jgi:CDP-glucose 4,6-dehydratase
VQIRNPGAFRPWQHVLQALSGYLALAAKMLESDDPQFCSGWNIGPLPGSELPVRQIVELFLEEWGGGSWEDISDPAQVHEAHILRLAIDKAIWLLDWKPRWTVHEALRHTARWYRRYFTAPAGMRALSLEQIAAYEAAYAAGPNVPVIPIVPDVMDAAAVHPA